ncbi:hypothetical protein BH11ARM2_BH11ARM2_12260 [soil metagenome]
MASRGKGLFNARRGTSRFDLVIITLPGWALGMVTRGREEFSRKRRIYLIGREKAGLSAIRTKYCEKFSPSRCKMGVMLPAALLLSMQEPSSLDKALAASTEAIRETPAFEGAYSMRQERDEKVKTLAFHRWKDGSNNRYEFSVDGNALIRQFKLGERNLVIFPPQKAYSEWTHDSSVRTEEPQKVMKENSMDVKFSDALYFDLRSNPPFQITSDKKLIEGDVEVRRISFEAHRSTGTGSVKGVADFDVKQRFFLKADLEIFGEHPSKALIRRDKFEVGPLPSSEFSVAPEE